MNKLLVATEAIRTQLDFNAENFPYQGRCTECNSPDPCKCHYILLRTGRWHLLKPFSYYAVKRDFRATRDVVKTGIIIK